MTVNDKVYSKALGEYYPMILALIFTLMLFALFWLTGYALFDLLKLQIDETDVRHAYAVAAGVAVFSAMLFCLCLIKAYFLPGVFAGVAFLALGSVIVLKSKIRKLIASVNEKQNVVGKAVTMLFLLLTLPGFLLAMLPPFYKDTLIYHLYIPKLMISARTFVEISGLSNANFPLGMELIYGVGLMIDRPELCRLLHYGFFWLLLYTAYKTGNRFGKWGGLVAAIVIALTPSMQIVATWGYIDITLAFIILSTLLAISDAKMISGLRGMVFIGLLIGFSLWMKYLSLYFAGTCMILMLLSLNRSGAKPMTVVGRCAFGGIVAALFASPWYLKNLIQTGNPVWPYFTNLFGGKLLWDDYYNLAYFHLLSNYGYGEGIWKYLLAPWYMVRHARFESVVYDGVIGWVYLPLFLLVVAGVFRFRKNDDFLKIATLQVLIGYVLWLTNSQQMRFLLPTIALMPILGVAGTYRIFEKTRIRTWILGVLLVLSLLGFRQINSYYHSLSPGKYLIQIENRDQFLNRVEPLHPSYKFINRNLPADSKIYLLLVKNKRYYLERDSFSDSIFEHFTVQRVIRESQNAGDLHKWMLENGFTHILFDEYYIRKPFEPEEQKILFAFFSQFTKVVYKDKPYFLVEILPDSTK